jgi:hypothetical protein
LIRTTQYIPGYRADRDGNCLHQLHEPSTARSAERAKEVGIRKSIGAQRFQLGFQFLGETVLFIILAAYHCICYLALPYIERLSDRNLRPVDNASANYAGIFAGAILVTDPRFISLFIFLLSAKQY